MTAFRVRHAQKSFEPSPALAGVSLEPLGGAPEALAGPGQAGRGAQRPVTAVPTFSVIIPALNEEAYLEAALRSVAEQSIRPCEVIVVDNGSTDRTADVARAAGARVVTERIRGLPRAREAGRRAACGDVLLYVDADTRLPADHLQRMARYLTDHPDVVAVSHPFRFYDGSPWMNGLIACVRVLLRAYAAVLDVLRAPNVLFGGTFCVRRSALEAVGGFDTRIEFFGEDTAFAQRIAPAGRVAFLGNVLSMTSARRFVEQGSVATFWRYLANYVWMAVFHRPLSPYLPLGSWSRSLPRRRWQYASLTLATAVILAYGVASPTSRIFGNTVSHLPAHDHAIALTFDDGPNGIATEEVLDLLDTYHVRATFFLIGENVRAYPGVVREIAARGHAIGNHSWDHGYLLPLERPATIMRNVEKAEQAIREATGTEPHLFRPPHGFRTPWMIRVLCQSGFTVVLWNDMTTDYWARERPETIARAILDHVHPGSIIVLHDGLNLEHGASRTNTVEALRIILPALEARGYQFVTLDHLER